MILGRNLVPGPHRQGFIGASPPSSYPCCSLALVSNSSHSSLPVFSHLRTLSFPESHLSRALPTGCALFRKKPGVHPCVVIPSFFILVRTHSPLACPESHRRVYPERGRRVYPERGRRATSSISFISPTCEHQPGMSLVSPTYAKTRECTPTQKCRRADIFDFSPDISHFLAQSVREGACPERSRRAAGHRFCYSMERPVFLRHRSQRSANSYRKVPHP